MTFTTISADKTFKYAGNTLYAFAAGYVGYKFYLGRYGGEFEQMHSKAVEDCKPKLIVPWYGQMFGQVDAKQRAMTAFEKCVGSSVEAQIKKQQDQTLPVDFAVTAGALGLAIVFSTIADFRRKKAKAIAIEAANKPVDEPQP